MIAEETAGGTQRMIYKAPIRLAIAPSHKVFHEGHRLVPSDERAPP
jgi:hypothetical protein